ncbi:lipoate--protein ligase family protein [Paenibacillus sp. P96]|uniref:Lipoate--protein ligase family protein n=1 Tax=Paenibacillus zeirhizosphaerae TaxID=2987519 RepID=A0ABT9FLL9_9BACL|nr:lipoate--protein ligase family protein [Paenibacillus sp. P96]MDP4095627.1 lipoate--protein ligase family protein [Paenibacillus sp. P96]
MAEQTIEWQLGDGLAGLHIIDRGVWNLQGDIWRPFAWEELACRQVGRGEAPLLHMWRCPKALVIGHRDRRLAAAGEAMAELRGEGIPVCVRPSGGAAVLLDEGVLNLSLILPNPQHSINIHNDFRLMAELICGALTPWSTAAAAGEIAGSFCPGDYDIAISGRKFCGIAQRRQAKAYIITAFIIVEGSGEARADEVRRFYSKAARSSDTGYPEVRRGTMGSLQELAGVPSVQAYADSLRSMLQRRGLLLDSDSSRDIASAELQQQAEALRQRYDRDTGS